MIGLEQFAAQIRPERTVLFLGAGSSMPSGAPSGQALANALGRKIGRTQGELSLTEISSIYEKERGRKELATAVKDELKKLEPTGGILLIPKFQWFKLYATNFDHIIEKSYKKSRKDIIVYRNNADFSTVSAPAEATQYLKIHGDINIDPGFGHMSRMLLTESDYENYLEFQEAAFSSLEFDLSTKDVLIIGHSLADSHLRELINRISQLHREKNTPGRVYLLIYTNDSDRASLYEDKGIVVACAGIDGFMHCLSELSPPNETSAHENGAAADEDLPQDLYPTTIEVDHAVGLETRPDRLFNGSPATYADIAAGFTFPRSALSSIGSKLTQERPNMAIIGAAGVGKTTLSRQLCLRFRDLDFKAWEHNSAFPFAWETWAEYCNILNASDKKAILYIDDCVSFLPQINRLLDELGKLEKQNLYLLISSSSGRWRQRNKSSRFFSNGNTERLSRLVEADLEGLLNLIRDQPVIHRLVDVGFSVLPRNKQMNRLRERCSADMYVCLKNIFASSELDEILLKEFAELSKSEQDVYRYVAALEALDVKVHRQLILRTMKIDAEALKGFLARMDEILSEYDIKPSEGLYGWTTRHGVIAKAIATYKFADQNELRTLFETIIENLNPAEWLEKDLARALCTEEYGLGRLRDQSEQLKLLNDAASLLPADKSIRHKLVRQYIDMGLIDEASREIKLATSIIGRTSSLERFRVFILMSRAANTKGILEEDRTALLLEAERIALQNTRYYYADIHNYKLYGSVGLQIAKKTGDQKYIEKALELMIKAEETIMDPELAKSRRQLERQRRLIKPVT